MSEEAEHYESAEDMRQKKANPEHDYSKAVEDADRRRAERLIERARRQEEAGQDRAAQRTLERAREMSPGLFEPGAEVPEDIKAYIDSALGKFLITGPGVSGRGTKWVIAPPAPIPAADEEEDADPQLEAFDGTLSGTDLTFNPGTINGMLPSNMFSTFTVGASGTYYAYIEATASSGAVTAASIYVGTTAPSAIAVQKNTPPNSFDAFILAVVDGVLYQGHRGLFSYAVKESYRTDKSSPTPGLLPYESYYTWVLQ